MYTEVEYLQKWVDAHVEYIDIKYTNSTVSKIVREGLQNILEKCSGVNATHNLIESLNNFLGYLRNLVSDPKQIVREGDMIMIRVIDHIVKMHPSVGMPSIPEKHRPIEWTRLEVAKLGKRVFMWSEFIKQLDNQTQIMLPFASLNMDIADAWKNGHKLRARKLAEERFREYERYASGFYLSLKQDHLPALSYPSLPYKGERLYSIYYNENDYLDFDLSWDAIIRHENDPKAK